MINTVIAPYEKQYSVIRRAGAQAVVKGRVFSAPATVTLIKFAVVPAGWKDTQRLPEGLRTVGAVRVFSRTELLAADEQAKKPGDVFDYEGNTWEIQRADKWTHGAFWDCIAIKKPQDASYALMYMGMADFQAVNDEAAVLALGLRQHGQRPDLYVEINPQQNKRFTLVVPQKFNRALTIAVNDAAPVAFAQANLNPVVVNGVPCNVHQAAEDFTASELLSDNGANTLVPVPSLVEWFREELALGVWSISGTFDFILKNGIEIHAERHGHFTCNIVPEFGAHVISDLQIIVDSEDLGVQPSWQQNFRAEGLDLIFETDGLGVGHENDWQIDHLVNVQATSAPLLKIEVH